MTIIDKKFIKALLKGTKEKKIDWHTVEKKNYELFSEAGESVVKAYHFRKSTINIIVYKSTSYITDPYGDDIERANIHIVIGKNGSFASDFKLSDYEVENDSDMWTLYKLIQRYEGKVDSIMEDIIKDFGEFEF